MKCSQTSQFMGNVWWLHFLHVHCSHMKKFGSCKIIKFRVSKSNPHWDFGFLLSTPTISPSFVTIFVVSAVVLFLKVGDPSVFFVFRLSGTKDKEFTWYRVLASDRNIPKLLRRFLLNKEVLWWCYCWERVTVMVANLNSVIFHNYLLENLWSCT